MCIMFYSFESAILCDAYCAGDEGTIQDCILNYARVGSCPCNEIVGITCGKLLIK